MHIKRIKIENLKSIKYFEVDNLPDLVVFAGPNGTGKSTVLDAINIWKQGIAEYDIVGGSRFGDPGEFIRNGENFARIEIEIIYSERDVYYLNDNGQQGKIKKDNIQSTNIEIRKSERRPQVVSTPQLEFLLRYPDREKYPFAPIFDYYGPHRYLPPRIFDSFQANALKPENEQRNLIQSSYFIQEKARNLKDYFFSIDQMDSEWLKHQRKISITGSIDLKNAPDSFAPISKLIQELLPHLKFEDVRFGKPGDPVQFLFSTLQGKLVNIDGLSSGEKEVLSLFIEIYRKELKNSIVLIDEPELHLNQSVESRIIPCIQNNIVNNDNQVFIATHSSGILSSIDESNLFRINYPSNDANQCVPIKTGKERMDTLKTLVGDLSIFTTANKFIFLEGANSRKSYDKGILEILLPELKGKVTFIPSDSCGVVEVLSKKVQEILDQEIPFGDFYAVRDRDRLADEEINKLERELPKFAVWSRCMLENYLLDFETWEFLLSDIGREFSQTDIKSKFKSAAKNIMDKELDLRISDHFQKRFYMKDFSDNPNFGTINKLKKFQDTIASEIQGFEGMKEKVEQEINAEIEDDSFIKKFHGKNLMKALKTEFNINYPDIELCSMIANRMFDKDLIPEDFKKTFERFNL